MLLVVQKTANSQFSTIINMGLVVGLGWWFGWVFLIAFYFDQIKNKILINLEKNINENQKNKKNTLTTDTQTDTNMI